MVGEASGADGSHFGDGHSSEGDGPRISWSGVEGKLIGGEAGDSGVGGMVTMGRVGGRGSNLGLDLKGMGGGNGADGGECDSTFPCSTPSIRLSFSAICRMWSGVPSTSGFLNLTCLSSAS